MSRLKEAQNKLIEANIKSRDAYNELTEIMKDKSIPLIDRYSVMDNEKLSENFQLVELEWIFDEAEIDEIESWH